MAIARPQATCAINDVQALTRVCARARRICALAYTALVTDKDDEASARMHQAMRLWCAAERALACAQREEWRYA